MHADRGWQPRRLLDTELMLEVNSLPRSLSVTDRLCVVACEHHEWTLVSNDRALRKLCSAKGIRLRWGLSLMIDLVDAGVLTKARALKVNPGLECNAHHGEAHRPIPGPSAGEPKPSASQRCRDAPVTGE